MGGWSRVRSRDQPGCAAAPAEEIAEAVEEPPRDVHPHAEKGHQLDHGLHRHRGHETGLVLGEVEVARAEQDAEQGEGAGHEQGGVEDVEHGRIPHDHA